MKFYHYTSAENYAAIESGTAYDKPGLLPMWRLFYWDMPRLCSLPEKSCERVIHGLLDPLDKGWCKKTGTPGKPLLEDVLRNIRVDGDQLIYLLEATLRPKDDAYVADWSSRLKRADYAREGQTDLEIAKTIARDYWNSLIPFADYQKKNFSYLLPEVICFSPIPLKRVRVIRICDRWDLINEVRRQGGFASCPQDPKPDYTVIREMLSKESDSEQPEKPGHLRLIQGGKPKAPTS